MGNLLEQSTEREKRKAEFRGSNKASSTDKTNKQSTKREKEKEELRKTGKLPSTDNTTIPSPQTDNVDQTSSVKLTPKTDPSYKIWVQWSRQVGEEVRRPEFVKAIQTAYFKDK